MANVQINEKLANLQMVSSGAEGKAQTSGWISMTITHSVLGLRADKKFDPRLTGADLKEKLYMIVGTKPAYQRLQLKDKDEKVVCEISETTTLGSLPIKNGQCHVHVVDEDPMKSMLEFTDVSKVKKFELTDEQYDKRKGTFREWKKRNLKGYYQKKAADQKEKEAAEAKQEELEKAAAGDIKVGDRCQLRDKFKRRGEVKYVGELPGKQGVFVGVQLDEPLGKNDGSVGGKRFFKSMPKCGAFVKPSVVEVGDFPEEDIFDEL